MKLLPELLDGRYFLATVDGSQLMTLADYLSYIVGIFREEEGLSIVFLEEIKEEMESISEKEAAGPFALITLAVQSDLFSVGLLAAVTAALEEEKIACNAISAYHHDNLLVPYEKKDAALAVLKKLQK
ncbi:MAG: ACT domain-containing protein [Candidatus Anstonellaceae archaeon]